MRAANRRCSSRRPAPYSEVVNLSSGSKSLLFAAQERGATYSELHMAAGERAIMRLSREIAQFEGALVLIDEVEAGLHPWVQQLLMLQLQQLALRNDLQVIVTTHSPVVLDTVPAHGRIFTAADRPGEIAKTKLHGLAEPLGWTEPDIGRVVARLEAARKESDNPAAGGWPERGASAMARRVVAGLPSMAEVDPTPPQRVAKGVLGADALLIGADHYARVREERQAITRRLREEVLFDQLATNVIEWHEAMVIFAARLSSGVAFSTSETWARAERECSLMLRVANVLSAAFSFTEAIERDGRHRKHGCGNSLCTIARSLRNRLQHDVLGHGHYYSPVIVSRDAPQTHAAAASGRSVRESHHAVETRGLMGSHRGFARRQDYPPQAGEGYCRSGRGIDEPERDTA